MENFNSKLLISFRPSPIFTKNTNSYTLSEIGKPFIELTEVGSSNNYAMAQVQAQLAEHGTAWFAHHQTTGKGQRGKAWNTEPGQNILLSAAIEPTGFNISDSFLLSATIALACHDFFVKYAITEVTIKWPNDIYWRDRKAGGILIENIIQGRWRWAIVGIGININQSTFPAHIPNAVSLKQITGKDFDCVALAGELCQNLENRWQQLKMKNAKDILKEYSQKLYKLNEPVKFRKENTVFTAAVKGVTKNGELIVNNGSEIEIPHGDWEWLVE